MKHHRIPMSEQTELAINMSVDGVRKGRMDGVLPLTYSEFVDNLFKEVRTFDLQDALGAVDVAALTRDVDNGTVTIDVKALRSLLEALGDSPDGSAMHAAIGCSGEGGEMLDCVKKVFIYKRLWEGNNDGKPEPLPNLLEEMGDFRFYYQKLLNMLGVTDDEIIALNMTKLRVRYKSGRYSDAQAQGRADKVEPVGKSVPDSELPYNRPRLTLTAGDALADLHGTRRPHNHQE